MYETKVETVLLIMYVRSCVRMTSLKSECILEISKSVSSANQYLFVDKELTLKLENQLLRYFRFEERLAVARTVIRFRLDEDIPKQS